MRTQHQKPIGEQWVCTRRQCAAINFPKRPECYKCGSKRTYDKLFKFGKDDRDHKSNERRFPGNRNSLLKNNNRLSNWVCTRCGGNNWPIRDKCYQCRAPKKEAFRLNFRSNGKHRSSPTDFAHRKQNSRENKFETESRRFANGSERFKRRRRDDKEEASESESQPRIKSIVSTGPNEEDVDISQFDLSDFATIDEAKREEQNQNRAERANREREREKDNENYRSRHSRRDQKERKHEEESRHKNRSEENNKRSSKVEGRDTEREVKRSRRTRSESDETNENAIGLNTSKDSKKQENRSNFSKPVRARSASSSSSSSSESSNSDSSESHKRSRKRTSASKRRYR